MTAKKFLSQARFYKAMCRRLEDKIREIHEDMEQVRGVSYDKIRVQAPAGDSLTHYVEQLTNYETMLRNARENYYESYNEIVNTIDALESPLHRQILAGRYLEGLSFLDIAEQLDRSLAYIQNQHGIALKKIKVFS